MNANNTDLNETSTLTSEVVENMGTVSLEGVARSHRQFGAWWHFTRHLLEMVLAMMVGMGVLGAALALLGDPPGYGYVLAKYGVMGMSMAVPMVVWMRYRGHPWWDGAEMTAAMVVPMFALAIPVALDVPVPGLSEGSLMMLSHVAMIVGMIALMLYRWDRYSHGAHCHHV